MPNQIQERNIICPYCGAEDVDSWEHRDEGGDVECWECEKKFRWSRDCRVTYDSIQLCAENNIEHEWIHFEHESEGKTYKGKRCEKCDKYEFEKI